MAGRTRIAFICLGVILAIIGFVTCLYAWRSDSVELKELALLFGGSLTSVIGLIIGYYFGKDS